MAPFNQDSILNGLDDQNSASIKRVMFGVLQRLAGMTADRLPLMPNITGDEQSAVERIIRETAENTPVLIAATRFGSAHSANTATILRAAQEFHIITPPAVLGPAHLRSAQAVADVAEVFQDFVNGPAFDYGPDDATDVDKMDDEDPEMSDEDLEMDDYDINQDPEVIGSDRVLILTTVLNSGVYPADFHPNTPVRGRDTRIVDDGSHNRKAKAQVGQFDDSLLIIKFKAEKQDPKNKDNWLPTEPVVYDYRPINRNFDWNSKVQVKKLNTWRGQILRRALGNVRHSRLPWVITEQNVLFKHLREHLPTVEGRFSQINWDEIARRFNQDLRGRVFDAGDMIAPTQYTHRTSRVFSTGGPLGKVRKFEDRPPGAMKNQIEHFTHPMAKKIVANSKKADADYRKSANADVEMGDDTSTTAKGKGKAKAAEDDESPSSPRNDSESDDDNLTMQKALDASRKDKDQRDRNQKSGGESSKQG